MKLYHTKYNPLYTQYRVMCLYILIILNTFILNKGMYYRITDRKLPSFTSMTLSLILKVFSYIYIYTYTLINQNDDTVVIISFVPYLFLLFLESDMLLYKLLCFITIITINTENNHITICLIITNLQFWFYNNRLLSSQSTHR